MRKLRVLIACEESQTACIQFRRLGHKAYSCDIQECSGGHPEWHICGDVLPLLSDSWDIIIAHPPCTYLTKSSATRMFPNKILDTGRYEKMLAARQFFMRFYECDCRHVAIENPTPLKIAGLPPYSQVIQPYEFGHPYSKRTLLWLRDLPALMPTCYAARYTSWVLHSSWAKTRSKSFEGIAAAMANQWSDYVIHELEKVKK